VNSKIEMIVQLIDISYGNDYFDRYLCPADVYVYIFECNKRRYIWQYKGVERIDLIKGNTYKLKALEGRKLLGGRGISISDIEVID
jgi:hypothetical protein